MYFLFDIGGTNLRITTSANLKRIGVVKKFLTPKKFKDGIRLLVKMAVELSKNNKIRLACGGFPGPLNKTKSIPLFAPNLSEWANKPLKAELEKALKCRVFLENDAALAALGEAHFGRGKNSKILAYLAIGTGVGGSRVVKGRIDENHTGFEPGHQIIYGKNFLTLERAVSGRDILERYGRDPSKIKDKVFWDRLARKLAAGLANITMLWSPDLIVLGGGMIIHNKISVKKTSFYLKKLVKIFPEVPPVKKSALGERAALLGSMVYIKMNA